MSDRNGRRPLLIDSLLGAEPSAQIQVFHTGGPFSLELSSDEVPCFVSSLGRPGVRGMNREPPTGPPSPSQSTERNDPSVEAAFQADPAEMVAELLEGELHLSPRPARPHTNLGILLASSLMDPSSSAGEDRADGSSSTSRSPPWSRPDKFVPDLAGWRRERLPDAPTPSDHGATR